MGLAKMGLYHILKQTHNVFGAMYSTACVHMFICLVDLLEIVAWQ